MQLLFNENNNINEINKSFRKSQFSLKNRLNSILDDYDYIQSIQNELNLPLVPNERCGLWYIPPHERLDTCYFKSTDGHTNVWSFSLRRLNLHLIPLLKQRSGLIIVDSTRRGKAMPDALTKTIPIWCAVITSILYEPGDWLRLPSMIPPSEKSSIDKLIPKFIEEVKQLNLLEGYTLDKPILPKWYYPGSNFVHIDDESVYNLCLVSASASKKQSNEYVQGAADDHELWIPPNLKLDYDIFWELIPKLNSKSIDISEEELIEKIGSLTKVISPPFKSYQLGNTDISIGKIDSDLPYQDCCMVVFGEHQISNAQESKVLQYPIQSNKKGSNKLRVILPELIDKITFPCLILCDTGQDISCGVALVLLCLNYNVQWEKDCPASVSKDLIKQHLAKISSICKCNPSRSTLQAVNTYLFNRFKINGKILS